MENIRNFCIISHIDHGKSTLADRLLELTETVPKTKMREQFLDSMDLERERGITIKMQPVRMIYRSSQIRNNLEIRNSKLEIADSEYILNLIDTPGHADFSYEVSRSLAAVEGAILLVDASKGIQAQTIYNLELAKKQNLVIIPAVNKIDLEQAKVEETRQALSQLLNISKEEVFLISAKQGKNVEQLLEAVIEKVPPPKGDSEKPFRALIFDSKYDSYKGIVAFLRVKDGRVGPNEKICLVQGKTWGEVKELGFFKPELKDGKELKAGEIGYLATGVKEPGKVRVGDTIAKEQGISALPGYLEPKPVIFASIYPENPNDFETLKEALAKLRLSDASFTFELEAKESLGRGFRCGFLGSLHAEIVSERLKREFALDLIISTPSVVFKIADSQNQELTVFSPSDWPSPGEIKEIQEPWAKLEVITPLRYLGRILDLLKDLRGRSVETRHFGDDKTFLVYEVPLKGIICGFYDNLKGASQGFASMNYEILGYRKADLAKLEVLIAGEKEEAFSKIIYADQAQKEGSKIVRKLKEVLPSQLFSVPLQAVVSGRIIARETISAKRRDVTAPLYGGDYTRKRKLLEKQKKGKKKLKEKGKVRIPSQVFLDIFRLG
ncbi:MAG: translation elongation factor 4 [bacterium]